MGSNEMQIIIYVPRIYIYLYRVTNLCTSLYREYLHKPDIFAIIS